MYAQLFNIIAPVLILALVGFGWKRMDMPFDPRMVTLLVGKVAAPCLVVATLVRLEVTPAAFGTMAGVTVISLALFMGIGTAVLRAANLHWHTYLPPLMLANTGNMGLPLSLFAFGQEGLTLAIAVFAVNALTQFTVGVMIQSGSFSLRELARTPLIYALLIGVALMLLHYTPPTFVMNALDLLGALAIPLMLLALGVSLASLEVRSLSRAAALSLLRIGMGFAVGVLLAWAFGLTGAARGVLIIQCSMPAAVFNYLFAQHYGRDAPAVASVVVVSVVMSFVLLPGILAVALDPGLLPWFAPEGAAAATPDAATPDTGAAGQ